MDKQQIEAILWDNDGVLVDTEKLYFRASREVLAENGIDLTWDAFRDISLRQGRSIFDLAQNAGCPAGTRERMREQRNALYSRLLRSDTEVIDGVRQTLEKLHGKIPMAIVTSSLRRHFDIIHENSDLLPFFDFVLTREDYDRSKPHPEPYLTALERLGIGPRNALVVEDSERGLRSALRAEIPCVVVASTAGADDFSEALAVVPSVASIPSLLSFPC